MNRIVGFITEGMWFSSGTPASSNDKELTARKYPNCADSSVYHRSIHVSVCFDILYVFIARFHQFAFFRGRIRNFTLAIYDKFIILQSSILHQILILIMSASSVRTEAKIYMKIQNLIQTLKIS